MIKQFVFDQEDHPGEAWLDRFLIGRAETERWYLGGGRVPPDPATCRAALFQSMPELIPQYDRACELVGADAFAHCILSQFRPPPMISGCSQAVWLGRGGPALVRNYDFPLDIVTDRFELTSWSGRRVIAKAQRPWGGCIDGMNEDGLVVALNFGGSPAHGEGFAVILILRYLLEICSNVPEAIDALVRIPVALSQNVTLLDHTGTYATVFIGPDRQPHVTRDRVSTNHQEQVVWPEHARRCGSVERLELISALIAQSDQSLKLLTDHFLSPPIYSRRAESPTVYTAVYRPCEGFVDYIWPDQSYRQSFDQFAPGVVTYDYGALDTDS